MITFAVIIPARYESSRLPGKPLLDIKGKPMIQWVYERAVASGADKVIVATDDERILQAVNDFGGQAVMTGSQHASGTDRIAEVMDKLELPDSEVVINVQGDEPMLPTENIVELAKLFDEQHELNMATLCTPIETIDEVFDPNVVKVVRDLKNDALYFSRAPIPYHRDEFSVDEKRLLSDVSFYRHLGIYGYRVGFLKKFVAAPQDELEKAECLEQLRALRMGEPIKVEVARVKPGPGVDTPEDLELVRSLL